MWPRTAPLPRATCRNSRLPPRAPCGARSFCVTAQSNPLRCQTRRSVLPSRHFDPTQQRRWITQKYLQRMQEGREEWARHAEEIKAGKRKNFAAHLEERGLIHDVVGYECHSILLYPDGASLPWNQRLKFSPCLQRAPTIAQSIHREESWYLLRNRPHGTFDARWTYAAFYGIGLGIRLGITGDFLG